MKARCPGKGEGTGCGLQGQQGEWPHGPVPEIVQPRLPVTMAHNHTLLKTWWPRMIHGYPHKAPYMARRSHSPAQAYTYLTSSPSLGLPSSRVASCGGLSPSSASCHDSGSVPHRLSVKNSCRRSQAVRTVLLFPFSWPGLNSPPDHLPFSGTSAQDDQMPLSLVHLYQLSSSAPTSTTALVVQTTFQTVHLSFY